MSPYDHILLYDINLYDRFTKRREYNYNLLSTFELEKLNYVIKIKYWRRKGKILVELCTVILEQCYDFLKSYLNFPMANFIPYSHKDNRKIIEQNKENLRNIIFNPVKIYDLPKAKCYMPFLYSKKRILIYIYSPYDCQNGNWTIIKKKEWQNYLNGNDIDLYEYYSDLLTAIQKCVSLDT